MKLTKDQVKHVAKLANLPLTSEEEEKYSGQLSSILDYFEKLNKVGILRQDSGQASDVESTFNVSGQNNVLREDTTIACLSQEKALSNASQKKDGLFVTKGVFEEK